MATGGAFEDILNEEYGPANTDPRETDPNILNEERRQRGHTRILLEDGEARIEVMPGVIAQMIETIREEVSSMNGPTTKLTTSLLAEIMGVNRATLTAHIKGRIASITVKDYIALLEARERIMKREITTGRISIKNEDFIKLIENMGQPYTISIRSIATLIGVSHDTLYNYTHEAANADKDEITLPYETMTALINLQAAIQTTIENEEYLGEDTEIDRYLKAEIDIELIEELSAHLKKYGLSLKNIMIDEYKWPEHVAHRIIHDRRKDSKYMTRAQLIHLNDLLQKIQEDPDEFMSEVHSQ